MKKTINSIKLNFFEKEVFKEAAKATFNKERHRKDYGHNAYMVESSMNRAIKILGAKRIKEIEKNCLKGQENNEFLGDLTKEEVTKYMLELQKK